MSFFLDTIESTTGLVKEPSSFGPMENAVMAHSSTGSDFFYKGLRDNVPGREQTHKALKAWANYESYS